MAGHTDAQHHRRVQPAVSIRVKRKRRSTDVIDALTDLFIVEVFQPIRSDNSRRSLSLLVVGRRRKAGYTSLGITRENGYCDSFTGHTDERVRWDVGN